MVRKEQLTWWFPCGLCQRAAGGMGCPQAPSLLDYRIYPRPLQMCTATAGHRLASTLRAALIRWKAIERMTIYCNPNLSATRTVYVSRRSWFTGCPAVSLTPRTAQSTWVRQGVLIE